MSRLLELARVSISIDTLLNMDRDHLTAAESNLVDEVVELLTTLESSMASILQKS